MSKKIFIIIISVLILLGCVSSKLPTFGKDFQNEQIFNGTPLSQIEEIFGTPQRKEIIENIGEQPESAYYYIYQGPTNEGKFISKELIVVFSDNKVIKHNYSEKIILKLEKDSKSSNNIIQID